MRTIKGRSNSKGAPVQLSDLILPSFAHMLEALSGQLDKAAAFAAENGNDEEGLLSARLAPDMLPLSSQIQFSCLQAEEAYARLANMKARPVPDIVTLEQAQRAISQTIALLRSAGASQQQEDPDRMIALDLPSGMSFDFTLLDYVRSWALPQFYFHLITAYAILRHHGVDLGKADYVPHMFQFLRKETPSAP